jgi:hypothetical protein
MRRKISSEIGQVAVSAYLAGSATPEQYASAVRFLLEELGTRFPGNSVEVRVPPLGAVQCVAGPVHKRGTPPNVVELDPESWLLLATARASFEELKHSGKLSASGAKSDLADLFPIFSA